MHFVTSLHRSDCFRLERQLPGGIRTRWDTAPFHGARQHPGQQLPDACSPRVSGDPRSVRRTTATLLGERSRDCRRTVGGSHVLGQGLAPLLCLPAASQEVTELC